MNHVRTLLLVLGAGGFLVGCATATAPTRAAAGSPTYAVKVHEFEGCECNPVCPCVFSRDTTFGDCRGITVFMFDGRYGGTRLKNEPCVLVVTWAGKNMEATLGKWKGVLYTSDKATAAEREAIEGLLQAMMAMMGNAFAHLERRTAPIAIIRQRDIHDLTVGRVAHLKIHAIKGPDGKVATILNAPSPIAFPTMHCAIADVHTYNDGVSSWSFTGRNGFYADFDLSSAKHPSPPGQ